MALELNKLTHKINDLGANAAKHIKDVGERLPVAQAILQAIAADPAEMRARAEMVARKFRWAGAIPTDESVTGAFPAPARPTRLNVVAADGSQIYPDRHGLALYYLINVGSIVFRHGLPDAPSTFSEPQVFFEDEDLYYEEESSLVTTEMINARRDVDELGELARLATLEAPLAPTVALLDNSLLLYISLREQNSKFTDEVINAYLEHLDELKQSAAAVAGVVDRPRSANIVRLLHLASLGPDELNQDSLRNVGRKFQHITDGALFDFLKPGERSALFVLASPANLEKFQPHHHTVYFFFLNAGRPGKDSLLRVEVPEWVALDKQKLDWVHAAIVEQCKVSDGFPYVLVRAHDLAVVSVTERRAFDEMVAGTLIRNNVPAYLSQKQQAKVWTSSSKRRFPR
jgi:hypothetical protein